jgi:hypothetical protein
MLTGLPRSTIVALFSVSCVLACTGGGGGGGGGTGAAPLACRQKADSDSDSDCSGQPGKPRKLDCDSAADTDAAIAAGCTRTKPGDSDVCCPTTISGTAPGASSASSVTCRQKPDADTESDCASQTGKPRKLDCDSKAQTDSAVAAGCTPTQPGDSDVCCPLTVSGVADGSGPVTPDAGTPGPTNCPTDYSGTWGISGTCGTASCTVTQTGCTSGISCSNGTTLSGTISGTSATLSGTANGVSVNCTVTFSSTNAFSLVCGALCTGSGTRSQ